MNIDLLMTKQGDAGLVSDREFESPVAGVMFDAQMRQITLEHDNMDTVDLNIPIEDDITDALLWATAIQVGVLVNGQIQDNRHIPLMLLNTPEHMPVRNVPIRPSNSVMAFEHFLKSCVTGQPVHRDDLGNEDVSGSVMGGINRAVLEFSPQLARQRTLEASHNLNMSGPAPSGPGGMGGGGGVGASNPHQQQQRSLPPETRRNEEDDN